MKDSQREQVLDNARYLRQVRPIDPEEINEYVEGMPHPAAVRQVLREEATTLGLLEGTDGTFEPVGDEPVEIAFDGVDSFPEEIAHVLEDRLVERFGAGWPDGRSGARLRETIRDFKERYLHGATVTYDDVTALGYAIYHLPPSFATAQYVLAELAEDGLLPKQLRVLDVGAGVGGPALGLDDLLPDDALVEYHAVEPSDATDLLADFLEETGRNFHYEIHQSRIEDIDPDGEYDLILCANVLSELDTPIETVSGLLDCLAADGTLAAIEPADRNTAIELRQIERSLADERDLTVYAPTVRLWPHESPEGTCWSFTTKPDLDPPAFQTRLDQGDRLDNERDVDPTDDEQHSDPQRNDEGEAVESAKGPGDEEFVNIDVQYAYSLLRQDDARAIGYRPSQTDVAKLAETEKHVTDRIDCVAIKLSHDLSESGNSLYLLGDGSEKIDHFAVVTESTSLNEDLAQAAYGSLLRLENALVLWNDDEGAYNLVVDGQTIVELRSV
jgi:SAM-dependent methyltransferase